MASSREGAFHDFYQGLLTKGMEPAMARLTLARKIAAITLIRLEERSTFRRQTIEATSSLSVSDQESVPSLGDHPLAVAVGFLLETLGSRASIYAKVRPFVCFGTESPFADPMPPRMTQESCRPRVSDRTMVGNSATRLACEFQRTERRRHDEHETPTGRKKHGGPVAPRLTGPLRDRAKRSSS